VRVFLEVFIESSNSVAGVEQDIPRLAFSFLVMGLGLEVEPLFIIPQAGCSFDLDGLQFCSNDLHCLKPCAQSPILCSCPIRDVPGLPQRLGAAMPTNSNSCAATRTRAPPPPSH